MRPKSIASVDVTGCRVLVRADLNVPLNDRGEVTDTLRIDRTLPTVRKILDAGGSVVLMTHIGRPKGKVVQGLSTNPVARILSEKLGRKVEKLPGCVEPAVKERTARLGAGEVVLLENLRFYPAEKAGDEAFAKDLASHGDLYVSDAFGTLHRAHASVAVVPSFLRPAVAGLLVEQELAAFERVLVDPPKPFVLVLGGAKVSDKIPVMRNLIEKVDVILVGGGMAYTFLKAKGIEIGASLLDTERIAMAGEILKEAQEAGVEVVLPTDHVVASSPSSDAEILENGFSVGMGLDIGPATRETFAAHIAKARTALWNGPLGMFEKPPFAAGSHAVAEAFAVTPAFSVIGGGDTAAAVKAFGLGEKMNHISTGGGASLALLSGKTLPGVEALD